MTRGQKRRLSPDKLVYPPTPKVNQVDTLWGTTVADPYRWLETKSDATDAWIGAQELLTREFLDGLPTTASLEELIKKVWKYERQSVPWKRGNRQFFFKDNGSQNHAILYVIDEPNAAPRVLFDPNPLSEDGTIALAWQSVSDDGTLLAYGLTSCGSDWTTWHVRDIATGEDLPDHLHWVRFSDASWTTDGSGFFYCCYDQPLDEQAVPYHQKLFFHKLGTLQREDVLIYEEPNHKEWRFGGHVTEDGRYLIITVSPNAGAKNRIYYKDLVTGTIVKLLDQEDARWSFINNDGSLFWFLTDLGAPRRRLVAIDINATKEQGRNLKEVIAENKDPNVILEGVHVLGDRFFAFFVHTAHTEIQELNLDGNFIRSVQLPGIGSAGFVEARRKDPKLHYLFTSYTTPPTIIGYEPETGKNAIHFKPSIEFEPSDYVTKLVFVTSKDGTKIPLFITYRKGLKRNAKNPTYLYGYGGFGTSLEPSFANVRCIWMDLGGIYAAAILRGGGEYGEAWHQAGTKLGKQNVFDDFIACAEWLISKNYTCSSKLAIVGHSNGGLLVGACLTQRPELFGAAIPSGGVMDMIRYHRFTAGVGWKDEYGSVDNEEQFRALLAYSPLHNLEPGIYPATLVCTGDHDDRVVPAHSYKFAAALQTAQAGEAPCLIRIERQSGHGMCMPLAMEAKEEADRLAFLIKVLGIPAKRVRRVLDKLRQQI